MPPMATQSSAALASLADPRGAVSARACSPNCGCFRRPLPGGASWSGLALTLHEDRVTELALRSTLRQKPERTNRGCRSVP